MTRAFRWEHGGKGRKRAFGDGVQFTWDTATGALRAEVSKGDWRAVGVAGTCDEADQQAVDFANLMLPERVQKVEDQIMGCLLAEQSQARKELFQRVILAYPQMVRIYRAFCRARVDGWSVEDLGQAMRSMPPADAQALVRAMELFRTDGRRV